MMEPVRWSVVSGSCNRQALNAIPISVSFLGSKRHEAAHETAKQVWTQLVLELWRVRRQKMEDDLLMMEPVLWSLVSGSSGTAVAGHRQPQRKRWNASMISFKSCTGTVLYLVYGRTNISATPLAYKK